MEEWRPIKGYEGLYEVSNLGRVRSLDRAHDFKTRYGSIATRSIKGNLQAQDNNHNGGYVRGKLSRNGKNSKPLIHRLVAQAFVPNPDGKPHVNHKDGDRKNNNASNLEWVTPSENTVHGISNGRVNQIGRGSRRVTDQEKEKISTLLKSHLSQRRISLLLHIPESTINSIVRTKI